MDKRVLPLLESMYQTLSEAEPFPVGTVRQWKAGSFQKQPDGSWAEITNTSSKKAASVKNTKTATPISEPVKIKLPDKPTSVEPISTAKVPKDLLKPMLEALKRDSGEELSPKDQHTVRSTLQSIVSAYKINPKRNLPNKNKYSIKRGLVTEEKAFAVANWDGGVDITLQYHNKVKTALTKADQGKKLTDLEKFSLGVLIHEQLHCNSLQSSKNYQGFGILLEEVVVELSARYIAQKEFGKTTKGIYDDEINATISAATEACKESESVPVKSMARQLLVASLRTLRHPTLIKDNEEYLDVFVSNMKMEKKGKNFKRSMKKHLKRAFEKPDLYEAVAGDLIAKAVRLKRGDLAGAYELAVQALTLDPIGLQEVLSILFKLQDEPDMLALKLKGQIYDT